jgi:hypothetical protein
MDDTEQTNWRVKAENLAFYLRIYIHAHATGNSVPPHLDAEARRLVPGTGREEEADGRDDQE